MSVAMSNSINLSGNLITNAVTCSSSSKIFLKQLTKDAIAYILHQRVDFDRSAYQTRNFAGVTYKSFNRKKGNLLHASVKEWIKGAMDALNKNYLRELFLIFSDPENENHVLENYGFRYNYLGSDSISLDIHEITAKDVSTATRNLFEAIGTLGEYDALPASVKICIELSYYEDVTPFDYEPPNFYKPEMALAESIKNKEGRLTLGFINTGYDILKCYGESEILHNSALLTPLDTSNDADIAENNKSMVMNLTEDNAILQNDAYKINMDDDVLSVGSASIEIIDTMANDSFIILSDNKANERKSSPDLNASANTNTSNEDLLLKCPCKLRVSFDSIDLLICSVCNTRQHAPCMGFVEKSHAPDDYVCFKCDSKSLPNIKNDKTFFVNRMIDACHYLTKTVPDYLLTMLPAKEKIAVQKKLDKVNTADSKYFSQELTEEDSMLLPQHSPIKKRKRN